jgi:biotin carboxyl carrier protein
MDVARLNFSHGSHADHARRLDTLREASATCNKSVAALQDLCGPKIRTGSFPRGAYVLPQRGEVVLIERKKDTIAEEDTIPIQYEGLAEDVQPADTILIDDGRVVLRVRKIESGRVLCDIVQGGTVRDHAGVHLPSRSVRISTLTEKDKADLAQAKAAFERREALAKRPAISRRAVDKSRKAFERAQAQARRDEARIAQLQAALHAAETNLSYTDVVSPVDGTVVSRNAEMGQTVAAGSEKQPLFVIAAPAHIDAIIGAKDIRDVKVGDKATFTVEAFPNRTFSGAVTQIRPSPQTYEQVATYDVVISAPNPDLLLEPGMAATIRIVIE